jgi:hypothetical protein
MGDGELFGCSSKNEFRWMLFICIASEGKILCLPIRANDF